MKKRLLYCLLILIIANLWGIAAAQGCPPGQYPVVGQGWNYCAPVPGAETQQEPEAQEAKWQTQWQALATDVGKGVLGTSKNQPSQGSAETAAIKDCNSRGGENCVLQISHGNGCIAMVVGDKVLNTNGGATRGEAEQKGIRMCAAEDKNCRVYYSDCSPPVRTN